MDSNSCVEIAHRFNLWIKYVEVWYTPYNFSHNFQGQTFDQEKKRKIEFHNPDEVISKGLTTIYRWIDEKQEPTKIKEGIRKLMIFIGEVHRYYKPRGWEVVMQNRRRAIEAYNNSDVPDVVRKIPREYFQEGFSF